MSKHGVPGDPVVRFAKYCKATPSGCVEWHGASRLTRGEVRGIFLLNRRCQLAHRVAWMLYRGPIPDGLCVLHHCDNTVCVNVEHLFIGTQQDNVTDMMTKGRGRSHVGERAPRAKLVSAQVIDMRARRAAGASWASLGRAFGIAAPSVRSACLGESWKHLPMP